MPSTLPEQFPLSLTDQLFLQLEEPSSPFTLQMEARLNQRLDEEQLKQAILRACDHHPMTRVALAPWQANDREYLWHLAEHIDSVPLRIMDCPDDASLDDARSQLHSQPVPLDNPPPLRCTLARCPDNDLLMISMSHAASDGMGLYRFLTSVLRAYIGVADPQPELDFLAARDLRRLVGSKNLAERLKRISRLLKILGHAVKPPARIATEGGRDDDGLSFLPLRFSAERTRRLQGLRRHGATINDVLICALHLAIDRWNHQHETHSGRISMIMPLNTRPAERRFELASNLSIWVNVISRSSDRRDFATLLERITEQTARLKDTGTAGLLIDLLQEVRDLPAWAKEALPTLLPITGNRLVDTTVLNNLGQVPRPLPESSPLQVTELWFSSPCRAPMGMTLGAVSLAEHLYLSFRYRHSQFSRDSAWGFAETFLEVIEDAHRSD